MCGCVRACVCVGVCVCVWLWVCGPIGWDCLDVCVTGCIGGVVESVDEGLWVNCM